MNNLLKSQDIQDEIKEVGFAKIAFCDPTDIDTFYIETQKFLKNIPQNLFNKFVALANVSDIHIRQQSKQLVEDYFSKQIQTLITPQAESIAGVHLFKPFGLKGRLGLHFDCNIIDENEFLSINVWIPLQNCNKWNGTLSIVPYSHLLQHRIRPYGMTDPFQKYYPKFKRQAKHLTVKKGEAILLHTGLMHGSTINYSLKPRIAVNYLIKPKTAPLIHFFKNRDVIENLLEKFEVSDHFFKTANIAERPDETMYKFLGKVDYPYEQLTNEMVSKFIQEIRLRTEKQS